MTYIFSFIFSDDRTVLNEADRGLCDDLATSNKSPVRKRAKTTHATSLALSSFPTPSFSPPEALTPQMFDEEIPETPMSRIVNALLPMDTSPTQDSDISMPQDLNHTILQRLGDLEQAVKEQRDRFEREIGERDARIAEFEREIRIRDDRLDTCERELRENQQKVDRLEAQIHARDQAQDVAPALPPLERQRQPRLDMPRAPPRPNVELTPEDIVSTHPYDSEVGAQTLAQDEIVKIRNFSRTQRIFEANLTRRMYSMHERAQDCNVSGVRGKPPLSPTFRRYEQICFYSAQQYNCNMDVSLQTTIRKNIDNTNRRFRENLISRKQNDDMQMEFRPREADD